MSAGGAARGVYRFAEWTLKADPEATVGYVGKCLTCSERYVDAACGDDAQLWCLRHAGITGHLGYELSALQYFGASMANAAAKPSPPP